MGGFGSGWRYRPQEGKDTTNDFRSIDVRRFQRNGLLVDGQVFTLSRRRGAKSVTALTVRTEAARLTLTYYYEYRDGTSQAMKSVVRLDWTDCNFGGERVWFRCPASRCDRRVALLYFGRGGHLACRHCHGFAYLTQRESADDRLVGRINRIRARLGWPGGVLSPTCGRPRRMHWATYRSLRAEHNRLAEMWLNSSTDVYASMISKLTAAQDRRR